MPMELLDKVFKVERDILLYALRYSLGRQTFAPITTMNNIKENIKLFSINDIKLIIKEVKEQEEYGYGMKSDKQDWLSFIEYLEKELKKRQLTT